MPANKRKKPARSTGLLRSFQFKLSNIIILAFIVAMVGTGYLFFGRAEPPVNAYKGIWISTQEVQGLPMSGTAWTSLKSVADGDIGTPHISDQDNKHGVKTFGVSLVYARTGDVKYREKARAAIMSAIGTEDDPSPDGVRTLALGRNLGSYVLAADLINLEQMNQTDAATFRNWLSGVRTAVMPDHGRWKTLVQTHDNSASNWGAFAGASRIAADLYLGDAADLQKAAAIHRAYTDRSAYPAGFSWGNYFQPTSSYDAAWPCDPNNWLAINPPCTKSGANIEGAIVEDISRTDPDGVIMPQPDGSTGMSYSWETLQGWTVQAELLNRAGLDSWNWGNRGILRAMQFMERAGWQEKSVSNHVPWIVNRAYGTSFKANTPAYFGRVMGFTDWTHGPGRTSGGTVTPPATTPPPTPVTSDTTAPTAPTNLALGAVGTRSVTLNWSASTDNIEVTGYYVYRNGSRDPIAFVTDTTYTDKAVRPNKNYSYTVSAVDAAYNESPQSNKVTASTKK